MKFLTHPVASPLAAATDFSDKRAKLQQAMIFLGAIASGMEQAVGESANNISYLAGKNLGIELSEGVAKTNDLELALSATKNVLLKNNYLWRSCPMKWCKSTARTG